METCDTWQCVNSFAPWLSALGTIFISAVALWLSVRDKLIRVEARYSGGFIPSYDPTILDTYVYVLNFTNIGARDVTITNFEWHYRSSLFGKRRRAVIQPYLDQRVSKLCTKFPVKLSDGESGTLFFPKDFLERLDEPENFLYNPSKITAFVRIFTSNIYLKTSLGKDIKVKMIKRMHREIWEKYNKSVQPTANASAE